MFETSHNNQPRRVVLALSGALLGFSFPIDASQQSLRCDAVFEVTKDGKSPSAAIDGKGNIAIGWTRRSAWLRFFSSDGTPLTDEILLGDAPSQFNFGLSLAANESSEFVATWAASLAGEPRARKRVVTTLLRPNRANKVNRVRVSNRQHEDGGVEQYPAAGIDAQGRPVVLWMADEGIWSRSFDAVGQPRGQVRSISNSVGTGFPAIAMRPDGRHLAIWTAKDGQRLVAGVQARLFDDLGRALSKEVRLNSFEGQQGRGSVSVDDQGFFTVVWGGNGHTGMGIQARQVDSMGLPRGKQQVLFSSKSHANWSKVIAGGVPKITGSGKGDLFLFWMARGGNDPGGTWRILGGLGSQNLHPPSRVTRISPKSAGTSQYPASDTNRSGETVIVWQSSGVHARVCRPAD